MFICFQAVPVHVAMIEKLEFYHGAAIVRLIEDDRCKTVGKNEYGYLVNGDRSVFIKYNDEGTIALALYGVGGRHRAL
jgi:hypothetical protein